MANFKVVYPVAWERLEEKGIETEERPHVVPITLEAMAFMEEFAKQSHGGTTLFGGFYDPISVLRTHDGTIKAFRSLTCPGCVLSLQGKPTPSTISNVV